MAVEALQVIRQLVLSAVAAQAEYVDVDLTADTITVRDNGFGRCCPGVLRPSPANNTGTNVHASCGVNMLRCKQATKCQHAATKLGRHVIMICSEASRAEVVLWKRPDNPQGQVQVVSHVVYQMVPSSSQADGEEWELQPCDPVAPEQWQQALSAITSTLPGGQAQLEGMIKKAGPERSCCVHIMDLLNTFQIQLAPGSVMLLPPGPNPASPQTASGRAACSVGTYLGMLIMHPSAGISLQGEGVSEIHPADLIRVERQQFGPLDIKLPVTPSTAGASTQEFMTVSVSLVLGYDNDTATTSQEEFGIHIYAKDTLVDIYQKVPAMVECALPQLDQRLLGVATINNLRSIPEPGFLRSDPCMKALARQLDSWCNTFLRGHKKRVLNVDEVETPTNAGLQRNNTLDFLDDQQRPLKKIKVESNPLQPIISNLLAQPTVSGGTAVSGGGAGKPRGSSASSSQLAGLGVAGAGGQQGAKVERAASTGARTKLPGGKLLRGAGRWQLQMQEVLEYVMGYHRANGVFNQAVDPTALNIPDYFDIIPLPMDFGTILSQLKNDVYTHYTQIIEHMFLVLDNCCRYNPPQNDFHKLGQHMEQVLLKKLEPMMGHLATLALQDPPQDPLPEHQDKYGLDAAILTPQRWTSIWPPVCQIRSDKGLPLAGVRPFSQEDAEAIVEDFHNRTVTAFGNRGNRPPALVNRTNSLTMPASNSPRRTTPGGISGGGAARPTQAADVRASLNAHMQALTAHVSQKAALANGNKVDPNTMRKAPMHQVTVRQAVQPPAPHQVVVKQPLGSMQQGPSVIRGHAAIPQTQHTRTMQPGTSVVARPAAPGGAGAPSVRVGAPGSQQVLRLGPATGAAVMRTGTGPGPAGGVVPRPGGAPGGGPAGGVVRLGSAQSSGAPGGVGPRPGGGIGGGPAGLAPRPGSAGVGGGMQRPGSQPGGPPGAHRGPQEFTTARAGQAAQGPNAVAVQGQNAAVQGQNAVTANNQTPIPLRVHLSNMAALIDELIAEERAGRAVLPSSIAPTIRQMPNTLRNCNNTVSVLLNKLKEAKAGNSPNGGASEVSKLQSTIDTLQAQLNAKTRQLEEKDKWAQSMQDRVLEWKRRYEEEVQRRTGNPAQGLNPGAPPTSNQPQAVSSRPLASRQPAAPAGPGTGLPTAKPPFTTQPSQSAGNMPTAASRPPAATSQLPPATAQPPSRSVAAAPSGSTHVPGSQGVTPPGNAGSGDISGGAAPMDVDQLAPVSQGGAGETGVQGSAGGTAVREGLPEGECVAGVQGPAAGSLAGAGSGPGAEQQKPAVLAMNA